MKEMKEHRDIDKGFAWVVMVAAFVTQVVIAVGIYSLGVIQIVLLDVFDGGLVRTTWVLSLTSCMMNIPGPLVGFLVHLTTCRTTMMIGSTLICIGFIASAFVTCLEHLYITLSLLTGLGMGLLFSPDLIVLGFYFDKHLSAATAVVVTGGAVGMLAGPPLMTWFHQMYGWRGMFLLTGGLSLNTIACSFICRPNHVEKTYQQDLQVQHIDNGKKESSEGKHSKKFTIMTKLKAFLEVLNDGPVLLFCGSIFLWSISIAIVNLHILGFTVLNGASTSHSSFLFTAMGIANIVSRLLAGFGVNSGIVDQYILYASSFAVMSLIVVVLPFLPGSFAICMAFSAIFGLCTGGPYVVLTSVTKDLVGLPHMAIVFGVEMLTSGLGSLLGPPIAGFLIESSNGSYTWCFVFSGVVCGFSSLFSFLLVKCKRKNRPEVEIEIVTETHGNLRSRPNSILWASQISIPMAPSPYLEPRSRRIQTAAA